MWRVTSDTDLIYETQFGNRMDENFMIIERVVNSIAMAANMFYR